MEEYAQLPRPTDEDIERAALKKILLSEAFEAGAIFQNKGVKGTTSLWSDSIGMGFNKWLSPILKAAKDNKIKIEKV